MPAALFFSHSLSPRLQYVVDFLVHYYGLSIQLTSSEDRYLSAEVPCKINYSFHRLAPDEIWIHPHVLLFESAIHPVKVTCRQKTSALSFAPQFPVFFEAEGEVGFDLPAAIFYLLTRYEEYLPHQKDLYGRYAHQNALAYREGFLHLPLVNIWLEDFRLLLAAKNKAFAQSHHSFRFQPTYDIDIAWNYLHKGRQRTVGGVGKLLASGHWRSASQRIQVLRGKQQDPFDAYEWMDVLHQRHGLRPIYFFLVAEQPSKWDKNISIKNEAFQQLIKATAARYAIGAHPSWASGNHPELLRKEMGWLHLLSGQTIEASRQHFLRFHLPDTFRRLIAAGIRHEYSMGYGTINGFRASITSPFYWYDLRANEATPLLLHPLCFMDANSHYELKVSPHEAAKELEALRHNIQQVGGTMVTLFHNQFLGTATEFAGWRQVYEQFVARAKAF